MISKYKICSLFAGVLIISLLFASCTTDKGLPQKLNFNDGWKFYRGEADSSRIINASFSDSGWTSVHLPHAAGITPLDHPRPLPETRGINWYRKEFRLA